MLLVNLVNKDCVCYDNLLFIGAFVIFVALMGVKSAAMTFREHAREYLESSSGGGGGIVQ